MTPGVCGAFGSSLALVEPQRLSWQIATTSKGKRQTRAVFHLGSVRYNLSVSDPLYEARLAELPVGDHPLESAGLRASDRIWLTVSVTEPFEEQCYKLVAAVIVIPPSWG
jgi:hypothetical protein